MGWRESPTTGNCCASRWPCGTLGERFFYAEGSPGLLFTENETNTARLFDTANRTPYVKDGINNAIVHGRQDAVNTEKIGTKASAHYPLTVAAGASQTLRLRLSDAAPPGSKSTRGGPFESFDDVMKARRQEADEFYASVIPSVLDADAARVMRQALAGMMWSKQFYYYDVDKWLQERGANPFKSVGVVSAPGRRHEKAHTDDRVLAVGRELLGRQCRCPVEVGRQPQARVAETGARHASRPPFDQSVCVGAGRRNQQPDLSR